MLSYLRPGPCIGTRDLEVQGRHATGANRLMMRTDLADNGHERLHGPGAELETGSSLTDESPLTAMTRLAKRLLAGTVRVALRAGVTLVLVVTPLLGAVSALDASEPTGQILGQARALAVAGDREESIRLLEAHLEATPEDTDARVLLAIVLSWEQRFDQARELLEVVLADHADYPDALSALTNIELWTGHPEQAQALTDRRLAQQGDDGVALMARARALRAQDRLLEAEHTLDRLLTTDPSDAVARQMRDQLALQRQTWRARLDQRTDWFSDGRSAWHETDVALDRQTARGPVIGHLRRADRFGLDDIQMELEAYPRLGARTYLYVSGAYAPGSTLFPAYRLAVDVNRSLGHGYEGVAGYRRLGFDHAVSAYVAGLGKYQGAWYLSGRAQFTPQALGVSRSFSGTLRRYLGDGVEYVGLRVGTGAAREEIRDVSDFEVLDSQTVEVEARFGLGARTFVDVGGGYSRQDRVQRSDLRQYSIRGGVSVRF